MVLPNITVTEIISMNQKKKKSKFSKMERIIFLSMQEDDQDIKGVFLRQAHDSNNIAANMY